MMIIIIIIIIIIITIIIIIIIIICRFLRMTQHSRGWGGRRGEEQGRAGDGIDTNGEIQ